MRTERDVSENPVQGDKVDFGSGYCRVESVTWPTKGLQKCFPDKFVIIRYRNHADRSVSISRGGWRRKMAGTFADVAYIAQPGGEA